MEGELLLEVESLVKIYSTSGIFGNNKKEICALSGVSFKVEEGEIYGVIGPNGAGKTTLLHILLGLITPTSGKVSIFGLDGITQMDKIRRQINFSSTYLSLPFSLTVWENLRVSAGLYGIKDYSAKVEEVIDLMEINPIRDQLTKGLSSGQMARLLLAKALINDPKILFLDEPTASLDPVFAHKVRQILREIRDKNGCTIIFTSHNMAEMEELADRVIFIDRGSIITEGNPADIVIEFKGEDLEDVFLKIAAKNRVRIES